MRFDEVTGSTNATAAGLADAGAPEWTLVAAGHQTAGRGRRGRGWLDVPGAALLCSVVLRPAWLGADRAGLLPLACGAAVAAAVREVSSAEARCKWPNDLVLDGRKVGGILVEARVTGDAIEHAVAGIGVNLAAPRDVPGARGIGAADPGALLTAFLRAFAAGYGPDGAAFERGVLERYRGLSATLGERVEATTGDGRTVRGLAVDVDGTGALLVDVGRRTTRVASGDVHHLRPA